MNCLGLSKRTGAPLSYQTTHPQSSAVSKKWFTTAILVGSVFVVVLGGMGILGLLQSHGVINLSQNLPNLASALGTIGHNPIFWSMAVGGLLTGGGLIAWGAYRIHQAKKVKDALENDPLKPQPAPLTPSVASVRFTTVRGTGAHKQPSATKKEEPGTPKQPTGTTPTKAPTPPKITTTRAAACAPLPKGTLVLANQFDSSHYKSIFHDASNGWPASPEIQILNRTLNPGNYYVFQSYNGDFKPYYMIFRRPLHASASPLPIESTKALIFETIQLFLSSRSVLEPIIRDLETEGYRPIEIAELKAYQIPQKITS